MPDTFFRTFMYGAAAVALGAGVFIVTSRESSLEKEANTVYPADSSSAGLAGHSPVQSRQTAMLYDSSTESSVTAVALTRSQGVFETTQSRLNDHRTHSDTNAPFTNPALVAEPIISVGKDVIELTVPVNPRDGKPAHVPIAMALAADPYGVPQPMQEAAQQMALDFLENVADAAAVATDPQSAEYFARWQSAAFLSDHAFKMRYGRVAYVQMNQLLAQEAATGAR